MATFATEGVCFRVHTTSSALYGVVVARDGAASCQPTGVIRDTLVANETQCSFVSQDGSVNSYLALLA